MKRNQGIFIKEILLKYKELEQKGYSFTDIFSLNRVTSIESFTTNQVQSEEQLPALPDIQVSDTARITPAVSNVQDDIDFGEWGAE